MYSYVAYRIPFSETDSMGIVHHSYYNRYFERGRVEFLRQIGILYRELADHGIHFPVLRAECSYRRPLKFDDIILVESRISSLSKTRLCFSYRIIKQEESDKVQLSSMLKAPMDARLDIASFGTSEHCCLAPDGKPQRVPDEMLELLKKYYIPGTENGDDKVKKRN